VCDRSVTGGGRFCEQAKRIESHQSRFEGLRSEQDSIFHNPHSGISGGMCGRQPPDARRRRK
jgi:hypothetical protein